MSRSRRHTSESSLELLLDTICNTFGGVLFISILVVILLRMTGRAQLATTVDRISDAQMTRFKQQQAEASSRLESLQTAIENQQQLQGNFGKPADIALVEEVRRLERQRSSMRAARAAAITKVSSAQQAVEATAASNSQSDVRIKELEQQVTAAEVALEKEVASRTTAAKLPRQRVSSKREVGVLVGHGRLYIWHRYGPSGERLGINTDDVTIVDDKGAIVETALKRNGGTPIGEGADAERDLRAKLSGFDPKRMYIAIAIWEDTFGQFQQLKKVLVDLGFEYRLIPLDDDDTIHDHGGSDRQVQ